MPKRRTSGIRSTQELEKVSFAVSARLNTTGEKIYLSNESRSFRTPESNASLSRNANTNDFDPWLSTYWYKTFKSYGSIRGPYQVSVMFPLMTRMTYSFVRK